MRNKNQAVQIRLMRIFNLYPITVLEYIAVKENLNSADQAAAYIPEFSFGAKTIDSLNLMLVDFNIYYYGGQDQLVFSYKSCTSFNFESEGFDSDLTSLTHFIENYYEHTEAFLKQYGVITQEKIEKLMGKNDRLLFNRYAHIMVDNIRSNNISIE